MKKLSILIIVLVVSQLTFAQKGKVTAAHSNVLSGTLDKGLPYIVEAEQNEATKDWAKTYYVKGMLYQAIHEDLTGLYKKLDDQALLKSWEAYNKAIDLDGKDPKGKGKIRKDVVKQLSVINPADIENPRKNSILRDDFVNMGVEGFNTKEFDKALVAFENILIIDAMPEFNYLDTAIYYYVGIAAFNTADYAKAVKYFDSAIKFSYESPKCFKYKADILKIQGDTLASVAIIKEGLGKYPEDFNLLIDLVNYYLSINESAKAIEFLEQALVKDPTNYSLYFAKGVSYDLLKDSPNAIIAYSKAIELNPQYFEAYFNLGAIYYNLGAAAQNDGMKIPMSMPKEYDAKMQESKDAYKQAEHFFVKAHEISPKDKDALANLKEIYTKLQLYDKAKEIKDLMDNL